MAFKDKDDFRLVENGDDTRDDTGRQEAGRERTKMLEVQNAR